MHQTVLNLICCHVDRLSEEKGAAVAFFHLGKELQCEGIPQ